MESCTAAGTQWQAQQRMFIREIGSMGVMSIARLSGIITGRGLMTALARGFDFDRVTVGEWMTATVENVLSRLEVEEAAWW